MKKYFDEVKKNFGFGCMRLPMRDGEVDYQEFCQMTDGFLKSGFNYFDTAHGYLEGKSEVALRECLVKRHPRESYILTNKLSNAFFEKQEDIRPLFNSQLEACGVEYFDFYLMHAQNAEFFKKYKQCRAYETALELKTEGKIKHFGLSFHDKAEVLDMILSEYPQIEVVQIQFNYVDYEDAGVQAKLCYEVCRKHNKPVIVMEPVRGGVLANLPDDANSVLSALNGGSSASYAIRYAASFDGVFMVLSGMSDMQQLNDNIGFMKEFVTFNDSEFRAVRRVAEIFREKEMVACTACRYCTDGCPKKISIPDLFADLNSKTVYKDWNSNWYYSVHTQNGGRASDCIQCGRCESVCPQHLKITELLKKVSAEFDKQ